MIHPDWEMLFRLFLALVMGSIVGFERALRDKPAGFRTNILICLGACIFTLASQVFTGPGVDQTRIASQIVTGVGFLGAGAIIRDSKSVIGLTTAATIWTMAAIGMAAGFGMYALTITGTLAIVVVLMGFPFFGSVIERRRDIQEYRLLTAKSAENLDRIEQSFANSDLRIITRDYYEQGESIVFAIRAMGPRDSHRNLRRELLLRNDIKLCEIR